MTRSSTAQSLGWRFALTGALLSPIATLLLIATPGCKGNGQLVLVLDRPNPGRGLDPMEDPRLDHFSLVVRDRDGVPLTINTVPLEVSRGEASLGDVPAGEVGAITLVGYSATNQVLAWAETGPLTIDRSRAVPVHLAIRKPFTYVAGGTSVLGFDTTLTGAEGGTQSISVAGGGYTMDVASTPDGRTLLVCIGDPVGSPPAVSPSLQLISTASHTPGRSIGLGFVPGALSLSPDGRWAVVSEYQPPGTLDEAVQVAVIDVEAALAGAPDAAKTVNMANAGRVAFARNRAGEEVAVILRAALDPTQICEDGMRNATLSVIRLRDGTLAAAPVGLGALARDIASDPTSSTVYVALSCANQIVAFDVDSNAVAGIPWRLPAPASLQISGSSLWVGSTESVDPNVGVPASLVLYRIDPYTDAQTEPERMDVPYPSEAVVMSQVTGTQLLVDVIPFWVMPYRLAIPPGEGSVSALVIALYHANSVTVSNGTWTSPEMTLISASYLGIDTGAQDVRRRFRARCYAFPEGADPNDPSTWLACRSLPSGEQPEGPSFFPRGATSIYGVP